MLYEMLCNYIKDKLYENVDKVQEMLVVYYTIDKLTSGETMNLLNELFPKNENIYSVDDELATIPLVEEEEEFEISHSVPQKAFNIVEELLKAGKIDNYEDKLKFFLLTGQLSKEQINTISEIGVSTIPEL